jgi:hypothetical protein
MTRRPASLRPHSTEFFSSNMTAIHYFQSVYLRLSPASCEIVKSLRGSHHARFAFSSALIAIMHGILYAPKNNKLVLKVLKRVSSEHKPFVLQIHSPFRTRSREMKSVSFNVKSAELLGIWASLRRGLGGAVVIRRLYDGSKVLEPLKKHPAESFRPRIPICHHLLPDEADQMVNELLTRLEKGNLCDLTAVGLSLGPTPHIDRARDAGLQIPPWKHFSFSGSEKFRHTIPSAWRTRFYLRKAFPHWLNHIVPHKQYLHTKISDHSSNTVHHS